MKALLTVAMASLIMLFLSGLSASAAPKEYSGVATYVYEGDRFSIKADGKKHVIQLYGVDAPETGQPSSKKAKRLLTRLVKGKDVRVIVTGKGPKGIIIAKVYAGDTDVNIEMVNGGFAWADPKVKEKEYGNQQLAARANKQGLWGTDNPIPPWEWRQGYRSSDFSFPSEKAEPKDDEEGGESEFEVKASCSAIQSSSDNYAIISITGTITGGPECSQAKVTMQVEYGGGYSTYMYAYASDLGGSVSRQLSARYQTWRKEDIKTCSIRSKRAYCSD